MKRIYFIGIVFFGLLGMEKSSWAETLSIPDNRRVDWTYAGVPGGIPNITTNCTTTACNLVYSGGANVTAANISAAITSAGKNEVVRIPAGTFPMTSEIKIYRSDVVLRGAGMGQTILTADPSYTGIIISTQEWAFWDTPRTITSGTTKGSTSFVASNVSDMVVGEQLGISEANESFMWTGLTAEAAANNLLRQLVKIESIKGNTVTFSRPLLWDFTKSPIYTRMNPYSIVNKNIGIEGLTIDNAGPGTDGATIGLFDVYYSWVKNVEIEHFADYGIQARGLLQSTIEGCKIHDGKGFKTYPPREGHAIFLDVAQDSGMIRLDPCSSNLIENNTFYNVWMGIVGTAQTGNVMAYNFSYNNYSAYTGWTDKQIQAYDESHRAHSMFNLWEGNVGAQFQVDGYWGSASHSTLFRNKFDGLSALAGMTGNRKMIDLDRFTRYYNVIGNVLGDSSWTPASYEMSGNPDYYSDPVIYRLGYPYMGNNGYTAGNPPQGPTGDGNNAGLDPAVKTTLIRHRNYDYYSHTVRNCSQESEGCQGVTGADLPDSLYLAAKPYWWCNESAWPPVNPNGSTDAQRYSKIPAQIAYEGGTCTLSHGDTTPPAAPTGLAVN